MRNKIQKLFDDFKANGWKSNPYDTIQRHRNEEPQYSEMLVEMMLELLPRSVTFFDDAISYVREEELPRLAALAMGTLRQGRNRPTAEMFLTHCSLQRVEALHPFLSEIYELKPNWDAYYADWPWRESGLLHFDFLKHKRKSGLLRFDFFKRKGGEALELLLETRHPSILEYCAKGKDTEFLEVGFVRRDNALRQLYGDDVWHFVFPATYWKEPHGAAVHWFKKHPTWNYTDAQQSAQLKFGGLGKHTCAACGGQGHHLFTLPSIPAKLQISGLQQVRFESCLSCLGWEVPRMFYHHESDGAISPVGYEGQRIVPQHPSEPFIEVEIQLAPTPRRWQWQDWGVTNSRQNLHRLGGYPCWIQSAEYLKCPLCQTTMNFLFQLDSGLLTGSESKREAFEWGSGGICYGHWCDQCKVSGYTWQCT
jgi:hypothetical protein